MQKFLFNLFLFLLPILVLAYPLDGLISNTLSSGGDEYLLWNEIAAGNIKADVAVYGSSRAKRHFHTEQLAQQSDWSAYNFGLEGHLIRLPYVGHKMYMAHNTPPKLIVFSVDYHTLQMRSEFYRYEQFLPYMLGNEIAKEHTAAFGKFSDDEFNWPLLRYAGEFNVFSSLLKQVVFGLPDETEQVEVDKNAMGALDRSIQYAVQNNQTISYETQDEALDLLQQFVDDCKQDKIPVVMVFSPVYFRVKDYISNSSDIHATLAQFASDNKIEFLDYTNEKMGQNQMNFSDGIHLNQRASLEFSNQFWKDLQNTATFRAAVAN